MLSNHSPIALLYFFCVTGMMSVQSLQIFMMLLSLSALINAETISGNRAGCTEEGEVVPAKSINIKDLSCFTCVCKNGFVKCMQERCVSQQGCYMLEQNKRDGECCQQCKGCYHNGYYHASGSEWRDDRNPCKIYQCVASIITVAEEICYDSHCHHLVAQNNSTCCKQCKSCMFNGQLVPEGREVTTPDDPCLKCHCRDGLLTCSKRACPVLQCPERNKVLVPGECCPICRGNRHVYEKAPSTCILVTELLVSGAEKTFDKCTNCTCVNGTNICNRVTCPVVTCPTESQTITPGDCCPHCPRIEESRATCIVQGQTYEDGDAWQMDSCVSCTCHQGAPRCAREMCPDAIVCPAHQKLVHASGECCPKCVESDGVCTVFGDPHYRTFDGKFFSFQGSCKYLLAADCVGRAFTIRVNNDARATKSWSWTKTVSLKIGDLKVNLGQKMRVKINGERIKPPFKIDGQVSIDQTEDNVVVKTAIGVRILWNGNSFLEVSVPVAYKNRLCGLCGNYNGIPRDDLKTRRGRMSNDTDQFGISWQVGGRKACDRAHDRSNKTSACSKHAAKKKPCLLIKDKVFDDCRTKVNDHVYLKSCGMDMCECPSRLCYCEALTAYAHECQRLGVPLGDWRTAVHCRSSWAKLPDNALIDNTIEIPLRKPGSRVNNHLLRPKWPSSILERPLNKTKRPPPPMIH